MKLVEIFDENIIRLPIYQNANDSFRKGLFDKLDEYLNLVKTLDFLEFGIIHSFDLQIKPVVELIKGIKESVDLYLGGRPSDAYVNLKKSFDMAMFSHLTNDTLGVGECLYRFRRQSGNYPLSQKELFHIPFHSRVKVDTQRYSIPGFPSLYAANSIYVAWEELQRLPIEELQAARLETIKPVTFFDLSTDVYLNRSSNLISMDPNDVWKHLIVWPLIAACSIKVRDKNSPFKPEYIIPQLMLQVIRTENKWDGIKFSSTHIDRNVMKKAEGTFFNYVLPVKNNKDDGYCDELCGMFHMSDVLSWQLSEVFLKPAGAFIYSGTDTTPYKVQAIELVPDKTFAYQYSVFGTLEKMLHSKPPTKIVV